jgi:DNA processing protein
LTGTGFGYIYCYPSNLFNGFDMEVNDVLLEIIALKRLKKKGMGEKRLFDLLSSFSKSNYDSLYAFIREKWNRGPDDKGDRAPYFSDEELKQYFNILSQHSDIRQYFKGLDEKNIRICTLLDEDFPAIFLRERLLPVFYYIGDISLLNGENVAVVGTREPTQYGIKVCERLIGFLGGRFNIVSGGAIGIDSVAHRAALKYRAKTIVVFGSSIDLPYPAVNKGLFEDIIQNGGLIISPYGPDEEFNEYSFVNRNKYIVEISRCVVVVEGGEKSGARITGEYALSKGKPVFAVPGPITSEKSFCPNLLIHKGAKILYSEKVLGEFLNLSSCDVSEVQKIPDLTEEEMQVLSALQGNNTVHIDDIAFITNYKIDILSGILLSLEMKGAVEELPGKLYRKRSF